MTYTDPRWKAADLFLSRRGNFPPPPCMELGSWSNRPEDAKTRLGGRRFWQLFTEEHGPTVEGPFRETQKGGVYEICFSGKGRVILLYKYQGVGQTWEIKLPRGPECFS